MKVVLIDTDVLIEVLRQRDAGIGTRWSELSTSDSLVACSPVTIAEIWHGAREKERQPITDLFRVMACVPIDTDIATKAGEYLQQFHRSHNLELGDALIAATAAVHETTLWTKNRKHYPMTDLQLY